LERSFYGLWATIDSSLKSRRFPALRGGAPEMQIDAVGMVSRCRVLRHYQTRAPVPSTPLGWS
jgi:hypothetical protein